MITVRRANERGHANHGWLDTFHTFSFADYHDPEHMGFRSLRVINEDRVGPQSGFPPHQHRDMEIITYILEGELGHKDSMGNGSVIRPGDAQRMSAGTGVVHSEWNHSPTEPVHLLQIWILPAERGIAPSYEQKNLPPVSNGLRLIASPQGHDGSVTVHQDAALYVGKLDAEHEVTHPLKSGRYAWLQLMRGGLRLGDTRLSAGDGVALSQEAAVTVRATSNAEFLLFDLA